VVANYYVPEGQELTLVGSNAAMGGDIDSDVEADRPAGQQVLEDLAERYLKRFPDQDGAMLRGGFTGIYDCSPDLQPLLGGVPSVRGLYIAAGFSGHGFKLCPAVGELLAQEICDGQASLVDLEAFSPLRFENNKPIRPDFSYSHHIESTGPPIPTIPPQVADTGV
jgi:glycine/D-amino acid oxidase-like deaminating enzyme